MRGRGKNCERIGQVALADVVRVPDFLGETWEVFLFNQEQSGGFDSVVAHLGGRRTRMRGRVA